MTRPKREPVATPDTAHYWQSARDGVLVLRECVPCGQAYFYPRSFCPNCLGDDVRWIEASGRGTLHTYIICNQPAPGFESDVPYAIAIIELLEGPRVMGNIVDVEVTPENLVLDMPLEVTFVEVGATVLPQWRQSVVQP